MSNPLKDLAPYPRSESEVTAESLARSLMVPPVQRCMKQPATWSPTLNFATSAPTATTMPAPSESGIRSGFGAARAYCASMVSRSR